MDLYNQPCLQCNEGHYEDFKRNLVDEYYVECTVCGNIQPRKPGEKMKTLSPNKKIYLAGPFFNSAQVLKMEIVEALCELYNVDYFSPRLHAAEYTGTIEDRKTVFDSDLEGLESCGLVLANLDWSMPTGNIIKECKYSDDGWGSCRPINSFETCDPGTCVEVGYTYALLKHNLANIKLVGYSLDDVSLINLMLTESCSAILTKVRLIEEFIESWSKANTQKELDAVIAECAKNHYWHGESQ